MKKFTLFMKEKGKENNKKKSILVRHLQSPKSISYCYSHICDQSSLRTDVPNDFYCYFCLYFLYLHLINGNS